jgi:hypothetical protein
MADKDDAKDYEVGYGKPPRESRFVQGHSGNLKGRPKGAKNLETIVNKVGKRRVKVTGKHGTRSMLAIEAMVYQLSVQALSGDIRAIREYLQLHRQVAESDQATLLAPVFHERDDVVLEGIRQRIQLARDSESTTPTDATAPEPPPEEK